MISEVVEISFILTMFILYSPNCLTKSLLESHYCPLNLSQNLLCVPSAQN